MTESHSNSQLKEEKHPLPGTTEVFLKDFMEITRVELEGTVSEAGLYSFSATCGDAVGQKASSYYTLNIQPGSLIKSTNYSI